MKPAAKKRIGSRIVLPAGKLEKLPHEGPWHIQLRVKYVGIGELPLHHDLLVLDENEKLKIGTRASVGTGKCITHEWEMSRRLHHQDVRSHYVCGSANSTMGPHWVTKNWITELKVV